MVKNPSVKAGDTGDANLIPDQEEGEGNGNPLQYSCLENSMDRIARRAIVHVGQRRKESDTTEKLNTRMMMKRMLIFQA